MTMVLLLVALLVLLLLLLARAVGHLFSARDLSGSPGLQRCRAFGLDVVLHVYLYLMMILFGLCVYALDDDLVWMMMMMILFG